MGKLLKLPPRRPNPVDAALRVGTGKVLLFTGVRYERTSPPADGPEGSADRPKRRRG